MGGVAGLSPTFRHREPQQALAVLDLKKNGAVRGAAPVIEKADVFGQKQPPGAMSGSGSARDQLRERNPRLGLRLDQRLRRDRALRPQARYDPIVQGMSGLCEIQGAGTGPPGSWRVSSRQGHRADRGAEHHAALLARGARAWDSMSVFAMLDAVIAFRVAPRGMAYHTFIGEGRRIKPVPGAISYSATKDGHMIASTVALREFQASAGGRQAEWLEGPALSRRPRVWSRTPPHGSR